MSNTIHICILIHIYIYIYLCSDCFTIPNVYSLTYILKILTRPSCTRHPKMKMLRLNIQILFFLIILYYNEYCSWTKITLKYTSVRKNIFSLLWLFFKFCTTRFMWHFYKHLCIYNKFRLKTWDNFPNMAAVSATIHLLKLQCTSKHTV